MTATPASSYTLFVLSGPHAGSLQRLAAGLYTLGSDLKADLVLSDPALAPVHAALELERDRVRIEPLAGPVGLDGAELAPGDERTLSLPATIIIGATRLVLRQPQDQARRQKRRLAVAAAVAAPLLLAGLYLLAGHAWTASEPAGATPVQAAITSAPAELAVAPSPQPAPSAPTVVRATPAVAAAGLRAHLAATQLDTLEIAAMADSVRVAGELRPAQAAGWRAAQIWFDEHYGGWLPLIADVRLAEAAQPPAVAIQALWLGAEPYLVAGDGRRYGVGAVLIDGWRIEAIGRDQVTLRRGEQLFSLTL